MMVRALTLLLLFLASSADAQFIGGNINLGGKYSPPVSLLTDNLSAFYECESAGVGIDATPNALTLTNVAVTPVAGQVGDACTFVSTSASLSHADNTLFDVSTGDFAYAFWMNASSGDAVLLSKGGASTADPGYVFYLTTGGGFGIQLCSATACAGINTVATGYNDGLWHHIAVNHARAGNMEVFVDGASIQTDSIATAAGTADNSVEFRLGRGSPTFGNFYYPGKLDQIGVWKSRILTVAQIVAMAAGMTYAQMVAWIP